MNRRPFRFVLVGPGRVGLALSSAWVREGHRCVGVFGSTPGHRRRARRRLATPPGGRQIPEFDLLLIATPDRAVRTVAASWATKTAWRGRYAVHTAGALPASTLAPLRRRGASVAAVHPLLSLTSTAEVKNRFQGVYFGIEGDPLACRAAARLVRAIGGRVLPVPGRAKPAYHLAACLASGHLLALLGGAVAILRRAGIPPDPARQSLVRLARSALDNAQRDGIGAALTGPAIRGDVSTLRRHRRALHRRGPGWMEIYRWLTWEMVREAHRAGRITRGRARELRRELAGKAIRLPG